MKKKIRTIDRPGPFGRNNLRSVIVRAIQRLSEIKRVILFGFLFVASFASAKSSVWGDNPYPYGTRGYWQWETESHDTGLKIGP
jgi:hypothetical protein